MNVITPVDRPRPALPELSSALRAAIEKPRAYAAADGSVLIIRSNRPSPLVIAEAQRVLPAVEASMQRPPRPVIVQWLRGIAAACRPTPDPSEVESTATWMANFSDLPAIAFTRDTLAHVGNHLPCSSYFPAPAKIRELVLPLIADQVDLLVALRQVAAMTPTPSGMPEPPRPTPTRTEREHVRRIAAERGAELNAAADRRQPPSKGGIGGASYLSDGQLLAVYEKLGDDGRLRAAALRAKLAARATLAHD